MKLQTLLKKEIIIGGAVVIAMAHLTIQSQNTTKSLNNIAPAAQALTATYTNDKFRTQQASKLVLTERKSSF